MTEPAKSNGDGPAIVAVDNNSIPPVAGLQAAAAATAIDEIDDFQRRLMEAPIDHEFNVGEVGALSKPTPSPSSKRGGGGSSKGKGKGAGCRKSTLTSEIDPRWLVPFQYGWRREIVQRGTDGISRGADTYYFPPQGKKLRSGPEIKSYLERTADPNLTLENFSFTKRCIYKEPEEIFRGAAPSRSQPREGKNRNSLGGTDSPAPADGKSTPGSRGRGRGSGRGAFSSPMSTDDESRTPTIRGRGRGRGSGWKAGSSHKREREAETDSPSSFISSIPISPFIGMGESDCDISPTKPKVKKAKFSSGVVVDLTDDHGRVDPSPKPVKLVPNISKATPGGVKKAVAKKRTTQPRPPSMTNRSSFAIKSGMSAENLHGVDPSPDLGDALLCGLMCPGRENLPPNLHCKLCMMLFHPECVNYPDTFAASNFVCKSCQTRSPMASGSNSAANDPTVPKPKTGEDVSTVDLSKIINQNQVSGQLLTLPSGVLNHLDLTQPLALKVSNKVLMIPPNCFISSDQSVKVFLPPGTLPNNLFKEKNLPINFNFYAKNNEQILNFTEPGESRLKDQGGENDKENMAENATGRLSRKQVKVVPPTECHFQKLHTGYDCMISIFKYLTIAELLRASRVCKTWTKVAAQDSLWKVVKLKESCVTDWEQAAKRFKNHNTWFLDLRGMLLQADRNRTWHQFTAVIDNFSQLRQINFGLSPACILHAVVEKLDKLEVLSAESVTDMLPEAAMMITNTKIDIGKFANLKSLEHLKLRGLCGLTLPAFSFNGGLTKLSSLVNLKTLVLTTLRNVQDVEFMFLGSLTNLETLEIGDCVKWNAEVYKQLGQLKKLKTLRLENGGDKAEPTLNEMMKQLKELKKIEIFNFHIESTLGDSFKELPKLESLSIWPADSAQIPQNNTNTLKIFKSLTSLQHIGWGLTENSEAIILQSEDDDDDCSLQVECLSFVDEEAEGEKRPEKIISITKLVDQLSSTIPSAKVKVIKVPAALSCSASASTGSPSNSS